MRLEIWENVRNFINFVISSPNEYQAKKDLMDGQANISLWVPS